MKIPDFLKFPVAVVGAGASGRAALRLLKIWNPDASIALFDDKMGVGDFHDPEVLRTQFKPATLVVSPGYPLQKEWIRTFIAAGGAVTSELALAVEVLENERVIGITGSLGKSTTVSLIGEAARTVDPHAFVGGNLGVPAADYAADVLQNHRPRAQWMALELSSYQLENAGRLRCEVSAFTFLSANHLERYASLDEYYAVKWGLARRTSQTIVINARGGDLAEYSAKHAEPTGPRRILVSGEALPASVDGTRSRLVGAHNRDNLAIAVAVAQACGWQDPVALQAMLDFGGLAHRLECLGSANDVLFINDSKATSMDSVRTAAAAVRENSPEGQVWLLLGGRDKKLPWDQLAPLGQDPRFRFVFFGECRTLARSQSGLLGPEFPNLLEAVTFLRGQTRKGDAVLLSPGGTSLDEFRGFEDRGRRFRELVTAIFGELQ